MEIKGYRLPAGTLLSPAITLVHKSKRNHPDAERFEPSRWVDRHPDPSVWLPFGGGTRRCLGAAFATAEMRIVIREVLRRVDLAPTDAAGERPGVRHVTTVPHAGAVVTVLRRRSVVPAPAAAAKPVPAG